MIVRSQLPEPPVKKRPHYGRRALLKLVGLGVLLEGLHLALYPLLADAPLKNTVVSQAVVGLFSWLPRLYWTTAFPGVAQRVAQLSWLTPANLLLLLLGLAFVLSLIAVRVGANVVQKRLSRIEVRTIFCAIIILTGIFALTYLYAPGAMSQDMFLYGLYGRMVAVHHVNPYVVTPATFPHDMLQVVVLKGTRGTAPYGPVWIDLSIPVALMAGESVANILIGFRLIGLVLHLVNAILIWVILAKLKPEARISATLLYAWNPVVLLLGVGEMHLDVVVVLFLLLAVLFFQRKSLTLGWVFVLLATLINVLCLVVLPLFFCLLRREGRVLRPGARFLWWLGIIAVSVLVVVLAYAPYWPGWGLAGIAASVRDALLQSSAINSLDAALLNLPIKPPPALSWLTAPHHWMILAIVIVGILVLLGVWLVDSLELVVLFSSWLFLALLVLLPTYWPWFAILPLALAACAGSRRTTLLAILLTIGAALSYYGWLWRPVWMGQGLVTVGLPLLIWGWTLFFTSTWHMTHPEDSQPRIKSTKGLSRPSWSSLPSWPPRRRK